MSTMRRSVLNESAGVGLDGSLFGGEALSRPPALFGGMVCTEAGFFLSESRLEELRCTYFILSSAGLALGTRSCSLDSLREFIHSP